MFNKGGTTGKTLAQKAKGAIAGHGELLTVTTPAKNGNPPVVRTLRFLPQPVAPSTLSRMQAEGTVNLAEGIPTDFVGAGDIAIAALDEVQYDNGKWEVLGVVPERYQGVTLLLHCVAMRR